MLERHPTRGEDVLLFARNFFRHPRMLGSLIPSSRFLIRELLDPIRWERARVIVEYGPGVGGITAEILERMRPDAQLIAIETNAEFVRFLRKSLPDERLHVVAGSAADVLNILQSLGIERASYVISGIPFSTLPRAEREHILKQTRATLEPAGKFLVYQFSSRVLPDLQRIFGYVERGFAPLNVLPARASRRRTPSRRVPEVFEGFSLSQIATDEVSLRVRHGGSGPPLLLLHGFPQTHAMWSRVAPRLAQRFTLIAPDLRGYGGSSKPKTTADHEPYSKRAMARDQIALMRHFGFERFAVAGHDRGGRCAYRLAIDFPAAVTRLAVLDIVPTFEVLRRTDMRSAFGYWHWFFLSQPAPLPERMLGNDPASFPLMRNTALFDREALADYLKAIGDPETVHAMCEDYRAGIGIDYQLDENDRGKHRIRCPTLALWGAKGAVAAWYDVLAVWRDWAGEVSGHAIDAGHFLAEEAPEPTAEALENFFA